MNNTITSAFCVDSVRDDFPILQRVDGGKPIVYLDSAATSLKPQCVIDAIVDFYQHSTANVGRGVHRLAEEATDRFDASRETIASFINAEAREVAFVRNTTEAINVVARSLPPEAKVLCALTEHHSNLLPWMQYGTAVPVRVSTEGRIDLEHLAEQIASHRPKLCAISHISNAFGVVQPIHEIVELCRQNRVRVLVDASQSVPHQVMDVRQLGCDFLCFSGHKMCGPSGIGVLYAGWENMQSLVPQVFGGGMVEKVQSDQHTMAFPPRNLEAGTPAIECTIGLAAACDYLESVGLEPINSHMEHLLQHALLRLSEVPGLRIHGPATTEVRSGAVTWSIKGVDSHTTARVLSDRYNICVRSGFHCAEPAHKELGVPPSVRASFYLYNTASEIDQLAEALQTLSRQPIK